MFLPNPGIMAAGAQERTYEDFEAHITALATSGPIDFNATMTARPGAYRTTVGEFHWGTMYGSPWQHWFTSNSNYAPVRLVLRHALPSVAVYDAQKGRQLFMRTIKKLAPEPYVTVYRNGFGSLASNPPDSDDGGAETLLVELIRWDRDRAWRSNPSIGSPEAEYTW